MTDDIDALSDWAEPLIKKMAPAERRKLMKSISVKLRKSNQERMKRQQNPDGSFWEVRKSAGNKSAYVKKSVEFLYQKGGEDPERRLVKSWKDTGEMITGYDITAGGLRSFLKSRIVRYIDINTTSTSPRRLRSKQGGIKKKVMFTKLRTAKFLKTSTSSDAAGLSFRGRIGEIARVHQFGERARVAEDGSMYDYPARQLLGLSRHDMEMIADEIIEHVSP